MLILERRKDEAVMLYTSDGVITVLVTATHQGNVWLGIDAPKSVAIQRDDIKRTTARGVQPAQPERSGDAPLPLASAGGV